MPRVADTTARQVTGIQMNELATDFPEVSPRPGAVEIERVDTMAPTNAMTVDVEDYFQVSAFERHVVRDDWERLPQRVEGRVERILELFAGSVVCGTFFTLGWVAERYPAMVRRIVAAGHELASHGWDHVRVTQQTPDQFRRDVGDTKKLLEDIGGCPVIGYRAASFSIVERNLWALRVLEETGHRYSSSVYPMRRELGGIAGAERFSFRHPDAPRLIEIPVTTVELLGRRLPCGGGGYFRLFPYAYSRWAMRRVNRRDRRSCVFFFHPWEIDPGQPRQTGLCLKSRVRHYLNLGRMEGRLERLLIDFRWGRMDEIFLDPGPAARMDD